MRNFYIVGLVGEGGGGAGGVAQLSQITWGRTYVRSSDHDRKMGCNVNVSQMAGHHSVGEP